MKKPTLFMFVAALLALGYWLYIRLNQPPDPRKKEYRVIIIKDNSTSQEMNCDALPGTVKSELLEAEYPAKTSTVKLFSLGDAASAYEPVERWTGNIPRVGISNFAIGDFAADLKNACLQIPSTPTSSIWRAAQVALEDLNAHGCGKPGIVCKLVLISDLEETVSRPFLRGGGAPQKLQNQAVNVVVCGYASTKSAAGPRGEQVEALMGKWRASFAGPTVVFRPYCDALRAGN